MGGKTDDSAAKESKDVEPGEDVEESVTGMEREEKEQTPNLFKQAKEITFKY